MKRIILATLAASTMMSGAALAKNGHGHGHGRHNGQDHRIDRSHDDRHERRAFDGPLRIADNGRKGNNGTGWGVGRVPPGHQKKMFGPGDRLPDGYRVLRDYDKYDLPDPGKGYEYRIFDGDVFKVAIATAAIAATLGYFDSLNN